MSLLNGNVGIGTASPGAKLDVLTTDATNPTSILIRNTNASDSRAGITIKSNNQAINFNIGISGVTPLIYTTGALPINFGTDNNTNDLVINTSHSVLINNGNVGIGTVTFGTSANKILAIGAGTAPTTSPADIAQLWVKDINAVAGQAGIHIMDETGGTYKIGAGISWASFAEPTCAAGIRGTVNYVAGGAGVVDTFRVCTKDAANAYAWRVIY
jgi:hypothetical protein